MRGNSHVRFGGRAEETDQPKDRPRASVRSNHTCAALLIAAGRHLEEVKTYLGHSSIRVTSDRYGHLFPEARAARAEALDATFRAIPAASPRPELEIATQQNADQRSRGTADLRYFRERTTGVEPATSTLARLRSTN